MDPSPDEARAIARVAPSLRVVAGHGTADARGRDAVGTLAAIVAHSPHWRWIADAAGRVIDLDDRWLAATGIAPAEALDQGWLRGVAPDRRAEVSTAIAAALRDGDRFDLRFLLLHADGAPRWMRLRGVPHRDAAGAVTGWYGYGEDIHDEVLIERAIRWNADHDALTDLPNRLLFNQRLQAMLAAPAAPDLTLLLIDVDHFKDVNDAMGHAAGDALLRAVAGTLVAALPEAAFVARIGGDEFAVLLDRDAAEAGAALLAALHRPFAIGGRDLDCRVSIGAARRSADAADPDTLFGHADIALYEAKARGRGRLVAFDPAMKAATQQRAATIELARQSAADGSIIAYYQPQLSLETGALTGFEALLRRRAPDGSIALPGSIAAAFDDLDVAETLGIAMLDRVVADMAAWRAAGVDDHRVAINVSTAELRSPAFVDRLAARLAGAGLAHDRIIIEVTEGVFLGRAAATAIETIHALHRAGFAIALDDFGTGFASLSHLRQIPVAELKIDRSFVAGLGTQREDRAIVAAIVGLARSLDLAVVAEGIETAEQAARLRAIGCHHAQGFLYARPQPAEAVPALIAGWDAAAVRADRSPLPL